MSRYFVTLWAFVLLLVPNANAQKTNTFDIISGEVVPYIPVQPSPSGAHAGAITAPGALNVGSSPIPYTTNWEELEKNLTTPDKIIAYMDANFSYSFHQGFTPYSPQTFNANKAGDCKDFATFAGALLTDHGYTNNIVAYAYDKHNPTAYHITNLYLEGGSDYLVSNGGKYGPIQNMDDLKSFALKVLPEAANQAANITYFPQGYQGSFDSLIKR
jgi:hypothetical protein